LTDRDQALLLAKHWEIEARQKRTKLGRLVRKPSWRVRKRSLDTGVGPLTQKEVGLLLKISERAVRQIEHRAILKLRGDPAMWQVWKQYLSGDLEERRGTLTQAEAQALFGLARTREELQVMRKILQLVGH
jgi:hypothetical protein